MQKNNVENIISIINSSPELIIIGFIDKYDIVDNLISQRLKLVLESWVYKIDLQEFDFNLIEDYGNTFRLVSLPTYNIYYNTVLLDQFDISDNRIEIMRRLSTLVIN